MKDSPIRQKTIVGQVMNEIRELIASNAYSPGDKIPTEKELAEKFGIGRSSIREAIKIFNYLGVLDSKAAIGTFVQDRSNISAEALTWALLLGRDELEEVIDLRASIELWCMINLTRGCSRNEDYAAAAVRELNGIIDDMGSALRKNDETTGESLIENDYLFHKTIIQSSGNPLFVSIYQTLRAFLRAEISKSQEDYADPLKILEEHRKILDTIAGGDTLQAIQVHEAHIENIKNRLKNPSMVH